MIAVIDYNAGNLTSVVKALHHLGVDPIVTRDPAVVLDAERILLPGVGHFTATDLLNRTGLTPAIRESIARGTPFLGICVGLQWLFDGSSESPETAGLGSFPGLCSRFSDSVKSPHVGWNAISIAPQSRLMKGVPQDSFVYFTHSYRAPVVNATVAVTNYDGDFTAAAEHVNVMGVQFHPEKSGPVGLRILQNFLEMPAC